MKVTEQQPAPVLPGTEGLAGGAGQGSLKTDKAEHQAKLSAPANVPAPDPALPAPIRNANLNAMLVAAQPMPSLTESIANELGARQYSTDWLRADRPAPPRRPAPLPPQPIPMNAPSPDEAQGKGLPRAGVNAHRRVESYSAAINDQPMRAPDVLRPPDHADPDSAQLLPSGSLSKVSPRGTAPGVSLPKQPEFVEGESEITTKLSRISGNKAFFSRHGLEEPRDNIRIPVLKLSVMRRDSDYKALITKLDSALNTYQKALNGTDPINTQTTEKRAQTSVQLNEQLDHLEKSVAAEQRALSGADPKFGQKEALLNTLLRVIDDERAMLVDVFSASFKTRSDPEQPIPWQHAVEFKRVGLNVGSNVTTGDSQDKVVKQSKALGAGSFNTVFNLKFKDGSEGVFKPSQTHEHPAHRATVATGWDVPKEQPRYEARNIASTKLDNLLDTRTLVKSEFFVHNHELGILMEKAPGQSAYNLCEQGDNNVVAKLIDDPRLHCELNKLQVLDALCGQHDRHLSNLFIATDANGQNVRVTGIDNDVSFGKSETLNEPSLFGNREFESEAERDGKLKGSDGNVDKKDARGLRASWNVGLPPLIDASLADKLLAPEFLQQAQASVHGLLSPTEIERMSERIVAVQQFAENLKNLNLTVTNWDSGQADNGQSVENILTDDLRHSYSIRFVNMATVMEQERLVNNAMERAGLA